MKNDPNEIIEHEEKVDTDEENKSLMDRCEDLYVMLEDSRWQHYDSVNMEADDKWLAKRGINQSEEKEVTASA